MPTDLDRAHQRQRAALAEQTARTTAAVWAGLDRDNLRVSWARELARVLGLVTAAQQHAAAGAEDYVTRSIGQAGPHQVVPESFAGHASDGRALWSLLLSPLWTTLTALARGRPIGEAHAAGASMLGLLVRTQIADAGRAADGVAMAAHPAVAGHERVVSLPACGRCIVLAGRLYRWSAGFARHPRCDCTMRPVTLEQWRSDNPSNSPAQLFTAMSPAQQDKAFTQAGAAAIRDGADVSQVVNARRGMTTATAYGQTLQATTEGTTRRGLYGRYAIGEDGTLRQRTDRELTRRPGQRDRSARTPRLMPAEIYDRADDRDHAVRLLRTYGYLR